MKFTIPVFRGKNPLLPAAEFITNPFTFTIEQAPALGDFYRIPFFFRKIFVTSNPEVIRHVLQTNQKNYIKSIAYRNLRLALGNGLVTSEGEFWRRQRRLAQPAFYKTQLQELFITMGQVAEQFCQQLQQQVQQNDTLDITQEMMRVTANIALKTLFSSENTADISQMYRIMMDSQDYIIHRTIRPYLIPFNYINGRHRRFRQDMAWFDRQIFTLIEQRRLDPNPPNDLLTMLLQARDEETGESMSNQQLRDETATLFLAGHETSSNALSWTLYLLAQHPAVLDKLRLEVATVLGDKTPDFEDLKNLPYTLQVIQEGMRLYPPAFAVGREPLEDDEILGQPIPKGSVVFISIGALHRDARFWEKPHDFYPEHFSAEAEKERPRMAYMPFGAGPRMCIGNHFALMEMQLLLAMLIHRFDFELDESHPVETEPLITLKPKFGIRMMLKPRIAVSVSAAASQE